MTEPPRITAEQIRITRSSDQRQALIEQYYRRNDIAARTERALQWLVDHQQADGSWGHVPATALSVLALLGDLESADRTAAARRGIRYLLEQQAGSGLISKTRPVDQPYEHAIATRALCEASMLMPDALPPSSAQRAVRYIMDRQQSGGGWYYGYAQGNRRETVVSVLQMEALFSAYTAGWFKEDIRVALSRAAQDLRRMQDPDTGRYGAFFRGVGGPGITGAAILGLQLAGQSDREAAVKGLLDMEYSIHGLWSHTSSRPFYNSLQMHQALFNQDSILWTDWRDVVLTEVLSRQHDDGSWLATGEEARLGPAYATALCALMLQVPCRHPPLRPYTPDQSIQPLWRVTGGNGTAYLLASVPLRPDQTHLIGPQAERVFLQSHRILVECEPRSILQVLQTPARTAGTGAPRPVWPDDILTELNRLFKPARITSEDLQDVRPWTLALGLMGHGLEENGVSFDASMETHYRRRASMERKVYERIITPDEYATHLDRLAPSQSFDLIRQVLTWLRQSPSEWHNRLVEAWRAGRVDEVEHLIRALLGSGDHLLISWRADRVIDKIYQSMQSGETHFYVLNADLLLGTGGLLNRLQERGISAMRVEPPLRPE